MDLRNINIWLNPESGYDEDYRYAFTLRTRFISHYLSRHIRKLKFKTDGSYKMISITPNPNNEVGVKIRGLGALSVSIPFDQEKYESMQDSGSFDYYLELFDSGFKAASEFKEIPLSSLLSLTRRFRQDSCINSWKHKSKRFKDIDIEVSLNCLFTTEDFRLVATIHRISTKEELCSGTVIRTQPDEIYFDKMFGDILIDEKYIIITDKTDSPRVLINLAEVFEGKLNRKILGDQKTVDLLSY